MTTPTDSSSTTTLDPSDPAFDPWRNPDGSVNWGAISANPMDIDPLFWRQPNSDASATASDWKYDATSQTPSASDQTINPTNPAWDQWRNPDGSINLGAVGANPLQVSDLFWSDDTLPYAPPTPKYDSNPSGKVNFTDDGKFILDPTNASSTAYRSIFTATSPMQINFNGSDVFYFPKSFVDKGYLKGTISYNEPKSGGWVPSNGDSLWQASPAFLLEETYKYLKPAVFSDEFKSYVQDGKNTDVYKNGNYENIVKDTGYSTLNIEQIPNFADGYIIDAAKYKEIIKSTPTRNEALEVRNPPRVPEGISTVDGKPVYVGMTKDDHGWNQRYDVMTVGYDGPYYKFQWSSSPLNIPALRFIDIALRITNPWYNLARAGIDLATGQGDLGDVALAYIAVNIPNGEGVSAAQGTVFEMPQIAEASKNIASFYQAEAGLDAAQAAKAAQATVDAGLALMANGMDFEAAIKGAAAGFIGREAAGQITDLLGDAGSSMKKIAYATTSATTRAMLLNQDPATAAKFAFVSTAVPEAVDSVIKSTGINVSKDVKSFITNTAIQAASGKDIDFSKILHNAVIATAYEGAMNAFKDEFVKTGIISANDKDAIDRASLAINKVLAGYKPGDAINDALIKQASSSAASEIKDWSAQKEGWQNYEQKAGAQSLYGKDIKPADFQDLQQTTEDEARELGKNILGRDPSEFEILSLIGLTENDAKKNLQNIKYDEQTFDTNEIIDAYKSVYGKEPSDEWFKSAEALDLLGRSEAQGKQMLQDAYTTDKNTVTNDELTEFLKQAGLKEDDLSEAQLLSALKGTELGVKQYLDLVSENKATVFDGTEQKTQIDARNEAIKNGFNTYKWGDQLYTILPKESEEQLKKDIASGKPGSVGTFFQAVPGKTLEQQLAEAGNPEEYAYQQGDNIVVVSKRLAVPDYNDAEAWAAFKAEKDALGGDNYASWLTEKFSILEQAMKGAPEGSAAKFLANAAMFGYGKMADLATTLIGTGKAMGLSDGTVAENVAKQVNNWSQKLVDQGIQNAEAAVGANIAAVTKETIAAEKGISPDKVSNAELYAQKALALAKQVVNNPLGVGLFVTGEAIQEVPFLAASAGMGAVFRSIAGKAVGASAALGTDVALNGAESFGGNYNEVRDYLIKKGVDPEKANAAATQSGLEAMGVSMLTAYAGDRKLVQAFMGDLSTDSLGKLLLTNSTKEWLLGNVEGYLQNASAQIGKYGEFKSVDEAMNSGIMEGLAQKALATGVISADKLSQVVVAKDSEGNNVTYKDIIDGKKTFDPSTIDKSVSFGAGLNLGDAIGYHSTFATNPDISPDEYFYTAQAFRDNGLTDFSSSDIAAAVGGAGELSQEDINKFVVPYADERVVTPEEARQAFLDVGYTPTNEEISAYTGQKDQQSTLNSITQKYNPLATTAEEARAILKSAGYANPTDAEIQQFIGNKSEADTTQSAQQYADTHTVTRDEAEQFFKSIGYTPTEEEINQFIGQGQNVTKDNTKSQIESYVDPRYVSQDEVAAAYDKLGLKKPTDADLQSLVGQYSETDLAGKAEKNLDSARYNSIMAQLDSMSVGADPATAQAIEKVKQDLNNKLVDLGANVNDLVGGLAGQITAAQADVQAKYDALTTEQKAMADALRQHGVDLTTAINTVQQQTQTQITETRAALEQAIADAKAVGLQGDAALQNAIDKVADDLGVAKNDVLAQLGKTEEQLRTDFATQLGTVQTQIGDVQSALTQAIEAAKAAGLQGDAALQNAIDKVAGDLGVAKTDLLSQLGKTEEQLRTDFSSQIGAVASDLQTKFDSLTDQQKALATQLQQQGVDLASAIEQAKSQTAGQIEGLSAEMQAKYDSLTAEQKALADQLRQQGVDFNTAISTATASIRSDVQAKYDALTTEQKALADQLRQQGIDFNAAIDQAKAQTTGQIAGLSAEMQAKYDALTAEQKALADQLHQQGTDLNTAINTAAASIQADVQAKYDALTAGQKALADQMTQQGVDLRSAIDIASQQAQQQTLDLGSSLNQRIDQLVKQGMDQYSATQQAILEVTQQNQQLQGLVGTQGRAANQSDIDALTQMLGGQRAVDLSYDVTGDKQITQDDLNFLQNIVTGTNADWIAPTGSPWAATGLYGQIQANEAQRRADLAAAERQRLADQQALEQQRQADAAAQKAAAQKAAFGSAVSQAQAQAQALSNQLPAAYKAAQQTTTPLYAGQIQDFNLESPLDVGFFGLRKEAQTGQNKQQTTKIATGGYLDDLLDLLR